MKSLINQIKSLEKSPIKKTINQRLKEFKAFESHSDERWFQELCFCILTANSKQKTAEQIEKSLGTQLLTISQKKLATYIRKNKHRFHNNKAKYICDARRFSNIKSILSKEENKREFLVKNIKGLGMKESSHFLRNTGSQVYAILDRHVLNILYENKIIEKPKTLTEKNYLEIEKSLDSLAKKLKMSQAKLDLFLWYIKTGEVAK